ADAPRTARTRRPSPAARAGTGPRSRRSSPGMRVAPDSRTTSLACTPALRQFLLAELPAEELERRAPGERLTKLYLTRNLVGRHAFAAVPQEILRGCGGSRRQDHERLHRLAAPLVRHSDGARFRDRGMEREHFVDLVRIDVESGSFDHVLLAPHDAEVAVRVDG